MTTKQHIDQFFRETPIALIGVSRKPKSFSRGVLTEFKRKDIPFFAVNPGLDSVEGMPCYPAMKDLPSPAAGAVTLTNPKVTLQVVQEAHAAGVRTVWFQKGSESPEAVEYCAKNGIAAIRGECVMMHLEPVESVHAFHRWLRTLFGRMPQ
jgi:uncharacterized protein